MSLTLRSASCCEFCILIMDLFVYIITEQQLAQEQVLELLPLIGEANAINEELDKHKYEILSKIFNVLLCN